MSSSFNEYYHKKTGLTVGVTQKLFSRQTSYQLVEVFETDTWGNLMTIDGMVMLSEKDEFVYHEMLSHVPLFSHPNPRRVLIIGGGDGGTAREVLRHTTIERVDLVEIDQTVVEAAREFLPEVGDWENPKLHITYADGIEFVSKVSEPYDVILIDGSDPVGPAKELFRRDFMEACHSALAENGVLATQTESPWVEAYHRGMRTYLETLRSLFEPVKMYLAHIPLYPAGMWSFAYASKGIDPMEDDVTQRIEAGMERFGSALNYYNAEIHQACFVLPGFVREIA